MLIRRFYYSLKPYVPWHLRIGLRRLLAKRIRKQNLGTWPIDPLAAAKPDGWQGWPNDKKFAVVLTHDVEGAHGLARCRELAECEIDLGFRSSFNFIPEGGYLVPAELRMWLTSQLFEVGVHDLEHDGRLFVSAKDFAHKAKKINSYLHKWDAGGFRAGFMLRNLRWLHHLDIEYDCSTFDTDPFEPQPDGVGTIFPFWIPAPVPSGEQESYEPRSAGARGGYVELPYTLPQDSTLYLVHRESSTDVWRKKLDWVATNGGMVLLNVHPDYLHFHNKGASSESVFDHYRSLLSYIKERYDGSFWHALPREVSNFVRQRRDSVSSARAHISQ